LSDTRAGLAHHFESYEQQRESASLGMWTFLLTEIMFFGGLFVAYILYRWSYPEVFIAGSRSLDITLGTINTGILIGSSLTMALAVRSAQLARSRRTVLFLLATIALGVAFLGIKAVEYHDKFAHHHLPGQPGFHLAGAPDQAHAQMFFVLYFAMTGLHALHMIVGAGLLGVMAVMAARGRFSAENHNAIECSGLYWHFVDIVWIFLFPLLYLLGAHMGAH
jgi:cytochrome c oxidase subunit 3